MSLEDLFCSIAAMLPPHHNENSLVALCYHRLSDHTDGTPLDRFTISPTMFARQLSTIRASGLPVIGPDRFFATTHGGVMITFDDNLPSHLRDAMPLLIDFGMRATFFLNPGELGQPGQLSARDVDALLKAGMWIGGHSNERIVASLYAPADFEAEVASCRNFLVSLGMPLMWAYPGGYIGSFKESHDHILRENGFQLRFSTLEGPCDPRDPSRVQGRYVLRRNCSDRYFLSALAGGLEMLRVYKKARARIWPASTSRSDMIDVPRY